MKKLIILTILLVIAISCQPDEEVTPGHILTDTRPVALKVDPVEFWPGKTVSMSLVLGGRTFSQDSDLPVKWLMAEELTLPYNTPLRFPIPENIEDLIPEDLDQAGSNGMAESIKERGYIDLPVTAEITIPVPDNSGRTRNIISTKRVRIYVEEPSVKRENPEIEKVVTYYTDKSGKVVETEVENGGNISFKIDSLPEVLLFRMIAQSSGSEEEARLSYSWSFTSDTSEKLSNNIDLEMDESKFHNMMEEKQRATPNREYMALNFKKVVKEIKENKIELPLQFNFYGVVRDNAINPSDFSEYRWGLETFLFTFEIK
jgi:hypothetical protein